MSELWVPIITLVGVVLSFVVSNRTAKSTVTQNLSAMLEQQIKVNADLRDANERLSERIAKLQARIDILEEERAER